MKRLRLRRNRDDLIRKIEHINLSKKVVKTKQNFIHDAKQIAKTYLQYRHDPEFKFFVKYLVRELLHDCDMGFINEVGNELRRMFSQRANESLENRES